ncbi:MAG: polysaccharide biosynthesis/export family protein, partial [Steroidobacteraceae bacterium]
MRDRTGKAQRALLALLLMSGIAGMACAADPAAGPGDYRIHGGDRLLVGVYDDPKMPPMDITVTPDGKFSFPLLGSLVAGGKTAEQLRVEMETKLRKYVAEPIVTVSVTEVKGNVAYVIGQV